MTGKVFRKRVAGFSLIELLCVMTIIAILASMMLPALSKALRRARGVAGHVGGPSGIVTRFDEVLAKYTRYKVDHPAHGRLSRKTLIRELGLSAEAEAWLSLSSVEYRPFLPTDPAEQPVIVVYPSTGGGSGAVLHVFTVGDLVNPKSAP